MSYFTHLYLSYEFHNLYNFLLSPVIYIPQLNLRYFFHRLTSFRVASSLSSYRNQEQIYKHNNDNLKIMIEQTIKLLYVPM